MSLISPPFIFIFFSLACHASAAPNFLYTYCPNTTFFPATNSALRSNLNTLLSDLSAAANSSSNPGFHNSTVGGTVYGLYLCRGDVDPATCMECVAAAAADLSQNCPRGKQAVAWYDQCMIRYSNESFFAQLDASLHLLMWNTQNITGNVTRFNQVLGAALEKVASGAASRSSGSISKFDTEEEMFNEFQSVYVLGQCTPDLSRSDCYVCLQQCIANLPGESRQGGRVLYFSCNLRYEIYLFYTKMAFATPTWLRTECPNSTLFSPSIEAGYGSNIKALLSALSSSVATNQSGFYNDTIGPNTPTAVYGLYLCRGDITAVRCKDCVATASDNLAKNCSRGKQAVMLYEECMIRYSNESFFGHLYTNLHLYTSTTPNQVNDSSFGDDVAYARGRASYAVETKATSVVDKEGEDKKLFATDVESIDDSNSTGYNIYMLGQCTPDLSPEDCKQCLDNCSRTLQACCRQQQGAGVYFFNCNLRYELYQFYDDQAQNGTTQVVPNIGRPDPSPSPSPPTPPKPNKSHILVIIIGSVIAGTIVMLFLGLAVWKRKFKTTSKADLSDIVAADSLKMDFNTIRVATQNFAIHRKLGQGGFGSVYKGTLENGEDIAVKRLSDNSGQGIVEFNTEVLIDAQLKHRNLVKLLGFCESGKEKILVYEYLPNSSFEKILFDPTKRLSLNWETRFKIICGIAKGLMYLHEDSRQRVVHRDLKPSNILLDEDMNPKISDFGLAKLFTIDQTQAVTGVIAGTTGYMAPEYVLMGHYSIKSDVYSFGIIVLEVISGQRSHYTNNQLEEALLYRAWKLWNEGDALKLMDESLSGNYAKVDAIKCIHIGLLCNQESVAKRPNMSSIVAALGGQSITLPSPSPPNFFRNNNLNSNSASGVSSGQGVSMGQTSELTELLAR